MSRAALALLVVATSASAQLGPPGVNVGPPLLVRIEGEIQPTRDAVKSGFTVVSLGFLDAGDGHRFIGVEDVRTIGGDQFVNGKDVLNALAPFDPMLVVAGPPEQAAALRRLPPGTAVRLEGLVDRASRTIHLRGVFSAVDR